MQPCFICVASLEGNRHLQKKEGAEGMMQGFPWFFANKILQHKSSFGARRNWGTAHIRISRVGIWIQLFCFSPLFLLRTRYSRLMLKCLWERTDKSAHYAKYLWMQVLSGIVFSRDLKPLLKCQWKHELESDHWGDLWPHTDFRPVPPCCTIAVPIGHAHIRGIRVNIWRQMCRLFW